MVQRVEESDLVEKEVARMKSEVPISSKFEESKVS